VTLSYRHCSTSRKMSSRCAARPRAPAQLAALARSRSYVGRSPQEVNREAFLALINLASVNKEEDSTLIGAMLNAKVVDVLMNLLRVR
jgi:hypothetical protein